MWVFSLVCQQLPARSPEFSGVQFPLCFRCAGFYGGLFLSYLFLAFRGGLTRSFPAPRHAFLAAILTAPYAFDGIANGLHLWDSSPWLRALTGLAAGTSIPVLLVPLASRFGSTQVSSLPRFRELVWPISAGLVFTGMLVSTTSYTQFQLMAIGCTLGLACLVVNLGLACMERGNG
jgi:uncharacterized membrane protein